MHNLENVISFSSAIFDLVAVFKSLSFNDHLSVNLLNQAASKLPPNLKEAWSMHTVRHNWQRPTLLDFNNWLKAKAEGHERLHVLNSKAKNEEPFKRKTTKIFAANSQVTSKAQDKSKFPPWVLCKGSHALWNCAVFKEKNATQRAKYVAEQKLCFACLNGNHSFRQCSRAKKCPKPECDSTHNVLLHGRSPCPQSNFAPFFVTGGYQFRCGSSSVHSLYFRCTGFTYVRQFRVAKNSN